MDAFDNDFLRYCKIYLNMNIFEKMCKYVLFANKGNVYPALYEFIYYYNQLHVGSMNSLAPGRS